MIWIFPLFNLAHNFAALILGALCIYCLLNHRRPVARSLAVFFFFSSLWALMASLIYWAPDLETKILLNRIKMISPVVLPIVILTIAASLSHWHIPRWVWALLSVIPVIGLVLLASPDHVLFITNYGLLHLGDAEVLTFSNGPWFHVASTQARLLVLVCLFIIIRSGKGHDADRFRIGLISVSLILPFMADSLAVMYWQELRYAQVVPTVLAITGLILFFAIFKYHVLEVVPYARSLVLDQMDDPFLVVYRDQTILDFNQAAKNLFSLTDSSIGRSVHEVLPTLDNLSPSGCEWQDHAHQRWFHVTQQPITERDKNLLGYLIQLRDKTLSKKVESQLREISHTKSKFLGIISHDLVENISGLTMLSDQLAKNHKTMRPEDLSISLDMLRNSNQQLLEFVSQLLFWAKQNLNVIELKSTLFSWGQVSTEILKIYEPIILSRNLTIECLQSSVQFYADLDMIRLVIRNILSNAIAYSPTGGKIILKAYAKNEFVYVAISNQGAPLNDELVRNLFELSSNRGSRGLGLILCKDFISAHKGEMGYEHESGMNTFYFKIPEKLSWFKQKN